MVSRKVFAVHGNRKNAVIVERYGSPVSEGRLHTIDPREANMVHLRGRVGGCGGWVSEYRSSSPMQHLLGRTEEQKSRRTEEQEGRRAGEQEERRTEEQKDRRAGEQKSRRTGKNKRSLWN